MLGVSRAGFYACERRPLFQRAQDDVELLEAIREVHSFSRSTYGVPRVHAVLPGGSRTQARRPAHAPRGPLRAPEPQARQERRRSASPASPPRPDLVRREWNPRLWVADITFVRTWEGLLYLAEVLDCHSRRCVGWSIADHPASAARRRRAVEMAIRRRRPGRGLVHHSDHGSQPVSLAMGEHLREAGIETSMGSKGSALDNAVVEAFFATLKRELVNRYSWPTKADARVAMFG